MDPEKLTDNTRTKMTEIERNCADDWWWNKLDDNGRTLLTEKYYPECTVFYMGFNIEFIRNIYEKETK